MKRITGEKVNIDHKKVQEFWNNRANTYTEENPYSSVKLRENKDNELEIWDEYEKELIFNNLHIDENSTVLDIGCGVGRMSKHMIPASKYYLGVDYSENLINLAKQSITSNNSYDFLVCDASEIDSLKITRKFNKILVIGCMQYLNDVSVEKLIRNILDIAHQNCNIYITNSEANDQRLTLNEFNSKVLGEYSSIYRTHDEYLKLFTPLFENGFNIEVHAPLSIQEHYSDTVHMYTIISRI